MNFPLEIFIGLGVTIILALLVKPVFKFMTDGGKPSAPIGMNASLWERIIAPGEGGKWLGYMECVFYFCMFWANAYAAIGGWLLFKVAAKWEAWSNIIQFPKEIKGFDYVDLIAVRTELGTWILAKFTIGTLLNILAAFMGVAIGRALETPFL